MGIFRRKRATTTDFRLVVEDAFQIPERGIVVTGQVERGSVVTGSTVQIVRNGVLAASAEVAELEKFRKYVRHATVGDIIGVHLPGVKQGEIGRGDVLTGIV